MGGLLVAALTLVVGTTLVPTHVSLGAGSLRCGTVLHPDQEGEIADVCGATGAHHLRAALAVAAIVAGLAVLPLGIRPFRQRMGSWRFCAAWGAVLICVALIGVLSLGFVEYAPPLDALGR